MVLPLRLGWGLVAVPSTLSPVLQHLRDISSKLNSHDGSINAEHWSLWGFRAGAHAVPPAETSRVHCCQDLPLPKVSLRLLG